MHVRLCLSGGEPLPPAVIERWKRLTGVEVLDGIGSSEALHIYAQNLPGKLSSARPARPSPAIGCASSMPTAAKHRGQPGELVVQGESIAKLYWNKPERTASAWTATAGSAPATPSTATDGYFFFCGRGDDMLKVGGIWVAPFEIKSALAAHPAVIEAAVIGAPDENGLMSQWDLRVARSGAAPPDSARADRIHKDGSRLSNIRAGSSSSTNCLKPKAAKSSGSSSARPTPSLSPSPARSSRRGRRRNVPSTANPLARGRLARSARRRQSSMLWSTRSPVVSDYAISICLQRRAGCGRCSTASNRTITATAARGAYERK